jgi:hypothetical protein
MHKKIFGIIPLGTTSLFKDSRPQCTIQATVLNALDKAHSRPMVTELSEESNCKCKLKVNSQSSVPVMEPEG